jgi:hypothetical protein
VDRKLAAEKVRARLERRLATFLCCEVADLPRLKIGTLVHTLFLIDGMEETIWRLPHDDVGRGADFGERPRVGLGTEARKACGEGDYQLMTVRPMNEQELRKEAERLIKAGKMPTLDELTQAIQPFSARGAIMRPKSAEHAGRVNDEDRREVLPERTTKPNRPGSLIT